MGQPAAFLDRDGTIIHDARYLASPDDVRLLPGVAATMRRLNDAGILVIVVTNQSGIARHYLTVDDYERVRRELERLLAAEGAHIDATYLCPHHPEFGGPCLCRKPEVGLFQQAAVDHAVELTRSLFVGDRWRDVSPAIALGGLGVLVPGPNTPPEDVAEAEAHAEIASTLGDAVDRWLLSPGGLTGAVLSGHPSP
jgi:histidinol-phosphate phosphatase family protein